MAEAVPFPAGCFSGELPSYATVLKSGQLCGTKDYSTNPILVVLLMVVFLKPYFFLSFPTLTEILPASPKHCISQAFDALGAAARSRNCVPHGSLPDVGLQPPISLSDGQKHSEYASGHWGIRGCEK